MAYLKQCINAGNQDRRPGYSIAFDYDMELIEALKKAIPHVDREWHEDKKSWWIAAEYEPVLEKLFANFKSFAQQAKLF